MGGNEFFNLWSLFGIIATKYYIYYPPSSTGKRKAVTKVCYSGMTVSTVAVPHAGSVTATAFVGEVTRHLDVHKPQSTENILC